MSKAIALLSLCLLAASCQQKLYFPDRANTPMLSKALEGKLVLAAKPQSNYSDSAHAGGGQASFAMDAAFAPVNHFGLLGSYRTVNNRRIDEDVSSIFADAYGGVFNGHRWELGAGYFNTFGSKGRFEAYAGYGQGTLIRRGYRTPERDFDTRYQRYFLQGAIGIGNDIFTFGGGMRFAAQRYSGFTSFNNPTLRYDILDGATDVEKETFAFMEPFVNAEVGWKIIRFTGQIGTSAQINGVKIAGNTPVYISLGACFHFDPDYFRPGGLSPRKVTPRKLPQ